MKTLNIWLTLFSYGLIMISFFYSLYLAKKEHHVNLTDVKNEIPNGYMVRTIFSIIYYFSIVDWIVGFKFMRWSYINENIIVNISGIILLLLITSLFWWISISLGSNYHGPMKLHVNHKLVKTGPYRRIRHPSYLAFPLFHISLFLITSNYLLLLSGLIMSIYTNHYRIIVEEKLLMERFGQEYEDYKKVTGRYFPTI